MKRALAIFAKTPTPGRVKTRLSPPLSPRESAELYRCMLLDTVDRVRALRVETVIFYDGDRQFFEEAAPDALLVHQHEGGLGKRLEEACEALSALGYGPLVIIGTDAPDLPLEYVRDAFTRLDAGADAVFGPATDGGYYLVALRDGYGELFTEIPWSSELVLETSLKRAEASGFSVSLLPTWYDVDSFEDLQRPGLLEPLNGAPLTRDFIGSLHSGAAKRADVV
ncbi:MAG TPA: glycosyltransferase [Geobacter sp.]|nr:glycosyltransferase [Geobacter sp.]